MSHRWRVGPWCISSWMWDVFLLSMSGYNSPTVKWTDRLSSNSDEIRRAESARD